MPKAYWIARIDVSNAEGYKPYGAAVPAILKKYRGRFLARGGRSEIVEGRSRSRHVMIEFPDYDTAVACYRSPEYQEILRIREANSVADLVIVEGHDEPS